MYLLNNRKEQYRDGLTIAKIIENKKYTYKKKIVTINGKFIEPHEFNADIVNDGDDVKIHHLLAGGEENKGLS